MKRRRALTAFCLGSLQVCRSAGERTEPFGSVSPAALYASEEQRTLLAARFRLWLRGWERLCGILILVGSHVMLGMPSSISCHPATPHLWGPDTDAAESKPAQVAGRGRCTPGAGPHLTGLRGLPQSASEAPLSPFLVFCFSRFFYVFFKVVSIQMTNADRCI